MTFDFDPITMLVGLSLLALAPFIAVMVTSYVKLIVVFSLIRNALGIQQIPPNMVTNGMAILLSLFIMAPVGMDMMDAARNTGLTSAKRLSDLEPAKVGAVAEPLRQFLKRNTAPAMRLVFLRAAAGLWGDRADQAPDPDGFFVLAPAFMLSELAGAFQIGFLLYLPFIVVDLVVSNILLAMGMMMVSPMTISLPFKLLLFVMANGWTRVIESLIYTYR